MLPKVFTKREGRITTMKKFFALFAAFGMLVALTGCPAEEKGKAGKDKAVKPKEKDAAKSTTKDAIDKSKEAVKDAAGKAADAVKDAAKDKK
ncbi:MAG: hypothetical protein ACKO23_17870 [Gemmataceae bacterium]